MSKSVTKVYIALSLTTLFVTIFGSLITLAPRYLLKPKDKHSVTLEASAYPRIAGPGIDLEHDLSIAAPATVRVSRTEVLTIRIVPHPFQHTPLQTPFPTTPFSFPQTISDSEPDSPSIVDGEVVSKFPDSYTLSLTASADAGISCDSLSKKATKVSDDQTWRCVIEPKTPGEHTILFSGLRFAHMLERSGGPRTALGIVAMDATTLQYKYVALTPWGLTEAEDRWVKLFAAFISIIGTILGYPFIKRLFDKPTPSTDVVGRLELIPVEQEETKEKATAAITSDEQEEEK